MSKQVDENGIEFYDDVPEGYVVMNDLWEIFQLMNPSLGKIKENVVLRTGLELVIYNPQTKQYYPRTLSTNPNREIYKKYWQDKNLYIKEKDLIWKKK